MGFAIATFVLCMAAVLGLYWALIVRPELRQTRAVTSRLGQFDGAFRSKTPDGKAVSVAAGAQPHAVPVLDALLRRHQGVTRSIDQFVLEAGMAATADAFLLASLVGLVIGGVAGYAWTRIVPVAAVTALVGALVPYLVVRHRRNQRLRAFEEQFPEAIDLVARALRAGHAFTTGLGIAADEMPAPVGAEFKRVYDQQNFGLSMPEALRAMARRVPVLDARFFVTAVLTQRESGGNLAEVLDNLSSVMRDRFKVKRQIHVISTHGRISGWVLSLVPPLLAAFLYIRQPAFMRILVDDPLGLRLVLGAVVLQLLGMYIISRMVRIEYRAMELQLVVLFVTIFVAVGAAMATLLWPLTDPQVTRRRLSEVAGAGRAAVAVESVLGDMPSAMARRARSLLPRSPASMNRVQRLMGQAGYDGAWPAITFTVAQLAIPLLVFAGGVLAYGTGQPMVLSALAAGVSYYLPHMWLERRIERRRTEIRNGLPDAIDLLIVCIEAGSGIDQALLKVAEELGISYPALARELELITAEMRAGKPRIEAFKNFAERTKVDDVRSLVAMLVQTDRFGTSLGQALRTHADTSRTKRRQRAEEQAAKLGVKLLFPLVFCLFPAFYLVVLGPSILRILRQLVWGPLGR